MSAISFDYPSISASLELPYSPVEVPVTQQGLANLTLWMNSEITSHLRNRLAMRDDDLRALARVVATAVMLKLTPAMSERELSWTIREEIEIVLGGLDSHRINNLTRGCELLVVPVEMHHAMTRTPLPALHPLLRVSAWTGAIQRWTQSLLCKLTAGFVPDSPRA